MKPPDDWELAVWIGNKLRERFEVAASDLHVEIGDQGTNVTIYEPGTSTELIDVFVTNIDRLRRKRREMGLREDGSRHTA